MTDLVIRYVHGVRTWALEHNPKRRPQQVLHDEARERRITLPPHMEHFPLSLLIKAYELAEQEGTVEQPVKVIDG